MKKDTASDLKHWPKDLGDIEKLGINVESKALEVMDELEKLKLLEKRKKYGRRRNMLGYTSNMQADKGFQRKQKQGRPTQWYEEAEADGLMAGNGKRAKRLRQLAKKDGRKLKKVTESRE
jgi:hypothetical protein